SPLLGLYLGSFDTPAFASRPVDGIRMADSDACDIGQYYCHWLTLPGTCRYIWCSCLGLSGCIGGHQLGCRFPVYQSCQSCHRLLNASCSSSGHSCATALKASYANACV